MHVQVSERHLCVDIGFHTPRQYRSSEPCEWELVMWKCVAIERIVVSATRNREYRTIVYVTIGVMKSGRL